MAAPPPQIVDYPADNSIARVGRPLVIVAHDTEGVDSRNTLKHGDGRGVSVHALIQKFPRANGSTDVLPGWPPRSSGVIIYRMVPDERGANHAGFSTWVHDGVTYSPEKGHTNVNAVSLSFELECLGTKDANDHYTEDQLLAAGWLINGWRATFGPLPIVRHADIDPGRRSDTYALSVSDLEKWANAAALVYAPVTKRYKVNGTPVFQQQQCTGPVALYLNPGAVVDVDVVYPEHTAHLATGAGFIRLDASVEAIQ